MPSNEKSKSLRLAFDGADDEARTRYLHLGKVALYQMSYIRISYAQGVLYIIHITLSSIIFKFSKLFSFFLFYPHCYIFLCPYVTDFSEGRVYYFFN